VLDIGCGFGFALRALHNMGFRDCIGLEQSPQQAEVARKAGSHVEVTSDSIEWLNCHKSAFDVVILLDVLEHLPIDRQIDFLKSIYDAMAPCGRLILTVPNANSVLASRWRYIDPTHTSSFTEHSLNFALRSAGFNKIMIDASRGDQFPVKPTNPKSWKNLSLPILRHWFIRWCRSQVFKAELPGENLGNISFELNLKALAVKD
jgi:SAM-dependent methyltransferase